MGWTMLYLFVFLKLPIAAACYIVWWAIKQSDEIDEVPSDGGSPAPRARIRAGRRRSAPAPPWRAGLRRADGAAAARPLGDGRRPPARAA